MNAGVNTPNIKPETRPQPSNRGTRMFCGLFILIGAVAIGCGAWTLLRSLRCQHWPTTEGLIEAAEMGVQSGSDSGSDDTYSANVSYDYQVAGIHYKGTRLAFGAMSASSDYAQGILDRYPVGNKVPVY